MENKKVKHPEHVSRKEFNDLLRKVQELESMTELWRKEIIMIHDFTDKTARLIREFLVNSHPFPFRVYVYAVFLGILLAGSFKAILFSDAFVNCVSTIYFFIQHLIRM